MTMQTSKELTARFLGLFSELSDTGLTTRYKFCNDIGADRRNFAKLLANPSRHILRPEWLANAVKSYGVSAHWLLTGEGTMYGL